MLPIGCNPNQIRRLEELVQQNVESLRHIGSRIVGEDGLPIRGAESCTIFTSFAVHPWAFGTLFESPPQTKEAFLKQQWVWLAMRGRTTGDGYGYAAGFDRWMNEGGIFTNMPQPLVDQKVEQWDRLFNPCQSVDIAKAFGIDKREFFTCVDGDYEPRSDKMGALLVNLLNESGDDLVRRIIAGEFYMHDTSGIEQAIVIQNPQSAIANAQSDKGGKSIGLVTKKTYSPVRRRGFRGSHFTGRNPTTFAGYSKFSNAKRPAPALRNGQRYYSPYRNQTLNPASSQYRPTATSSFSFADKPDTLYVSQDVTRDYKGQNYGYGSSYTTEQRSNVMTGKVQYIDRYRNGSSIFWEKDTYGNWTRTAFGTDKKTNAGPATNAIPGVGVSVDVTKQMARTYGSYDTNSTAMVNPNGSTTIYDTTHSRKGGASNTAWIYDGNSQLIEKVTSTVPVALPNPVAKQTLQDISNTYPGSQVDTRAFYGDYSGFFEPKPATATQVATDAFFSENSGSQGTQQTTQVVNNNNDATSPEDWTPSESTYQKATGLTYDDVAVAVAIPDKPTATASASTSTSAVEEPSHDDDAQE